jgi:hypothetical protein
VVANQRHGHHAVRRLVEEAPRRTVARISDVAMAYMDVPFTAPAGGALVPLGR